MIRQTISILFIVSTTPLVAMKDHDFDGVPDRLDFCPNTPFLDEVNSTGCSINQLVLPEETEEKSLILSLGYGVNTNEDLVGRERQQNSKIQLNYYEDSWSYSIGTGYYTHAQDRGLLDTTIKVKKRFKLVSKLKLGLGVGLKLPTYNFYGNRTDYTLYSSLNYYPTHSFSLFTRYNYSFINDVEDTYALRDSYLFSTGVGYFFTKDFYLNFSYANGRNKFVNEHQIESLSSTLYYKFNKQWFATLYYNQEINDEDFHETINAKIGYKIW